MTTIIPFGDIAGLNRQIKEKDTEIDRLRAELKDTQRASNASAGATTIMRLQIADLLQTVECWRANLDGLAANLIEMQSKLPE